MTSTVGLSSLNASFMLCPPREHGRVHFVKSMAWLPAKIHELGTIKIKDRARPERLCPLGILPEHNSALAQSKIFNYHLRHL